MSTIDAHVHLYPAELNRDPGAWALANGETYWATMSIRRRSSGLPVQGFPSLEELLHSMDEAGVERAVLLGWYWNNPTSCVWQNRFYAECIRQFPDRLSAFATFHVNQGRDAVLEEIRRAQSEGFVGLGELSPHSQGCPVSDSTLLEALSLAGELNLAINLHVTDPFGRAYPGRVETPLADFVQIARSNPRAQFILAHWGGQLPLRRELGIAVPTNVYYDTAASPLLYDAGVWRQFVDAVGPDRVLFGSDYPLVLYPATEKVPEFSRLIAEARAGLTPEEIAGVLEGNARRVLRL